VRLQVDLFTDNLDFQDVLFFISVDVVLSFSISSFLKLLELKAVQTFFAVSKYSLYLGFFDGKIYS